MAKVFEPRKGRRQRLRFCRTALVLAILLAASVAYTIYLSTRPPSIPLSVGEVRQGPGGEAFFVVPPGFVEQNVLRVEGVQTIVIGRDCTAIVADTSPERADALRTGLSGKVGPRPTVYDQWADFLASFGTRLEAVTLHDFDGNVYLSTGVFRQNSSVLELDMKPSDALALAVRTKSPIYLSQALLDKYGENIC